MLTAATILLLAAASVHAKDDDHHAPCACSARDWNFVIDCNDRDAMNAALSQLFEHECDTKCEDSDVCQLNYYIIQSHHDFCLHTELPEAVEDGIHIYEGACEGCAITRKFDSSLPQCPNVACDESGNEAYQVLLEEGCAESCDTSLCASNFHILKAAHDTCHEDVLATAAEQAFHDFEEACEAFNCNIAAVASSDAEQLICTSAVRSTTAWAAASATVVAVMVSSWL